MFRLFKDNALNNIRWTPSDELTVVEGQVYPGQHVTFTPGRLQDRDVPHWMSKRGSQAKRASTSDPENPIATIRILFVKITSVHPTALQLSHESYEAIEHGWSLHESTLSSLRTHSGSYSEHAMYESPSPERPSKLRLVLKCPQKWEITSGMLSLCHDFETKTTNAVWFHAIEYALLGAVERLVLQNVQEHPDLWSEVLFLPCVMLTDHLLRSTTYIAEDLSRDISLIEEELDVTRVGRRLKPHKQQHSAGRTFLPKKKAEMLIIGINTLATTVIFTTRSPMWHMEVCEFLLALEDQLNIARPLQPLVDLLKHNLQRGRDLGVINDSNKARLQLQLDVLYTMLSQTDNALSSRIAVSAGRDSTSMKILALITAAFLPGTFVATLFSMSMFQWQPDSGTDSSSEVVSPRFWIYWATAIPLTIVTLVGWGLWWSLEKRKFEDELVEAMGQRQASRQRTRSESKLERAMFPSSLHRLQPDSPGELSPRTSRRPPPEHSTPFEFWFQRTARADPNLSHLPSARRHI